jgi:hypothetical protein
VNRDLHLPEVPERISTSCTPAMVSHTPGTVAAGLGGEIPTETADTPALALLLLLLLHPAMAGLAGS